jgi:hypothetical protein
MFFQTEQQNTYCWLKVNGALRWLIVHGLTAPLFRTYLVNEYPKSGGTWLGQMLAEVFQIPFPRNRLPVFRSAIMHGHYLNAWNMKNAVIMWRDFVNQWYGRENFVFVKYEDLRINPLKELKRVVLALSGLSLSEEHARQIIDKYSFERQSNRSAGQENIKSFMRKGIIGDWQNCFKPKAKKLFAAFAGDELIRLGYETDYSWVNDGH